MCALLTASLIAFMPAVPSGFFLAEALVSAWSVLMLGAEYGPQPNRFSGGAQSLLIIDHISRR